MPPSILVKMVGGVSLRPAHTTECSRFEIRFEARHTDRGFISATSTLVPSGSSNMVDVDRLLTASDSAVTSPVDGQRDATSYDQQLQRKYGGTQNVRYKIRMPVGPCCNETHLVVNL